MYSKVKNLVHCFLQVSYFVVYMSRAQNYIHQNKSSLFDWLVFGISLLLGFIFPTLSAFVSSPIFSYCMLASVVLYTAGAWLKHLPLSYRLMRLGKPPEPVPMLLFLLVGHWLIFYGVLLFSEPAFRKIFGMSIVTAESQLNGYMMTACIFLAVYITWLVYRSKRSSKKQRSYSPGFLFRRELVADIFLITSISILSFASWEKGVMAALTHKQTRSISDIWGLFVMLSVAYILFYLPLRYLYLIEDHFSRQTWRRLLLIFGLVLIRTLFEMLSL
jgi:hypothetical protein